MKRLPLSDEQARAWHEGRFSVARRRIKGVDSAYYIRERQSRDGLFLFAKTDANAVNNDGSIGLYIHEWKRAPYLPGEIVFIGEAWRVFGGREYEYQQRREDVRYRADDILGEDFQAEWRSPITMPAWASRSKARIVSVRPEQKAGVWSWVIEIGRV